MVVFSLLICFFTLCLKACQQKSIFWSSCLFHFPQSCSALKMLWRHRWLLLQRPKSSRSLFKRVEGPTEHQRPGLQANLAGTCWTGEQDGKKIRKRIKGTARDPRDFNSTGWTFPANVANNCFLGRRVEQQRHTHTQTHTDSVTLK